MDVTEKVKLILKEIDETEEYLLTPVQAQLKEAYEIGYSDGYEACEMNRD